MTGQPGQVGPAHWRARAGHVIGVVLFRTLYRSRRYDADLVPRTGPVLFVSNHTGFLDGPFVFSMVPRPAHFIVKRQAFSGPVGALVLGVGQISIDREVGDRQALAAAVAVLRRGGAVGMFPEGTRGRGDVQQVHSGAAWLALQTGALVVPVACLGTRRTGQRKGAWPRPGSRLVAVFGAPFTVDPGGDQPGRVRLRLASETVRHALAAHVATATQRAGIPLPDDGADWSGE